MSPSQSRISLTGAWKSMCARVASAPCWPMTLVGSTPLCLDLDIFSDETMAVFPVAMTFGVEGLVKSTSSGLRKRPVEGSL